jgi:hypothetical protein
MPRLPGEEGRVMAWHLWPQKMLLVDSVKGVLRDRIRTIAQTVLPTPTAFKYVPAQPGHDPLRITDIATPGP